MSCLLYRTDEGIVVEKEGGLYRLPGLDIDTVFEAEDPLEFLTNLPTEQFSSDMRVMAPIGSQEVWAAGVTYRRSREARMDEARDAGAGDFYDRVYDADRPELFFKSTPHRTVGHLGKVRIRQDAKWTVPEPELTLAISLRGRIFGYTIGNDMSSRDIEGENPLYLPQAKVYNGSCAIGPAIHITTAPLPADTEIRMEIFRDNTEVFQGTTNISQIKRSFDSLVEFLFRDNSFKHGCFLMTGTGIVPPDNFTLRPGDEISITIEPIGTLTNHVAEI